MTNRFKVRVGFNRNEALSHYDGLAYPFALIQLNNYWMMMTFIHNQNRIYLSVKRFIDRVFQKITPLLRLFIYQN